jgi:hypothetical protein
LDSFRFSDALIETIGDPRIRALPPIGAIDQYVDNSTLTDRNHLERRRQYLVVP